MAAPGLGRSPTCLNCLRQLAQPRLATTTLTAAPASLVQTRHRTTKAELEDLQGIPVRLLKDIIGFGRKHAIIRVKPGRMRNNWFPYNLAEYMTRDRFRELGLTDAAIGVRDRTFGNRLAVDQETIIAKAKARQQRREAKKAERPPVIPIMQPKEALDLLEYIIPQRLTFYRKPITSSTGGTSEPATSAATAAASTVVPESETPPTPAAAPELTDATTTATATDSAAEPTTAAAEATAAAEEGAIFSPPPGAVTEPQPAVTGPAAGPMPALGEEAVPIFGSVSRLDILTILREALSVYEHKSRVVLEEADIVIEGLGSGEDRIKHLGSYRITISLGKGVQPLERLLDVSASDH